jgi:putative SOS response-associated peptidase YedK
MCGRYRLTAKERYIAEHFSVEEDEVEWTPRYNIAPTQPVATIRQDRKEPRRRFALMRWGLIPFWAKDASFGARTINAVSETAAEKPAFREAMQRGRCLIPADGFYEWKKLDRKSKQPYCVTMADDSLFAFAGLWDRWRPPAGEAIETCTVLTTDANALLRDVHDRMPVILRPEDYDLWLDPGVTDPKRVADLLRPFDPRMMKKYPVSTLVNNVKNDSPECSQPLPLEAGQPDLKLF